jgi:hypothetical protein
MVVALKLKTNLKHKEFKMITAPFIDLNGNEWLDILIEIYNRFDAEVAKREVRPYEFGSLGWQELEFYRNQRHKQFVQNCNIAARVKRESLAPKFVKESEL